MLKPMLKLCSAFALLFILAPVAKSEPWLGNRFAQNCAGCHAPGRINVVASKRKCTLSCQGCHVNPNGGGLRSHYGKWTEDRWLSTQKVSWLKNSLGFAPRKDQLYGKKPWEKVKDQIMAPNSKLSGRIVKNGLTLVETETPMNELEHDRVANPYTTISESEVQYLYQVPQDDPYRLLAQSKVDGGGDIRWMVNSLTRTSGGESTAVKQNFLMAADFALRARPMYRDLHFVYESRILGNPGKDAITKNSFAQSMTRSAYGMYDNLPYNTFVMAGLYRPLFGNATPDHTALPQKILASAQDIGGGMYRAPPFTAISVGSAPNVPFANVHILTGTTDVTTWKNLSGFALNGGLRFVKFGASAVYSFQKTSGTNAASEDVTTLLNSISLGATLKRTTVNYEAISYSNDNKSKALREGGTHSLDTYTRLFGETYFNFAYSIANVTTDILPGKAMQMKSGLRSFLIPGIDLQVGYETTTNKPSEDDPETKTSGITTQLHAYF